MQKDYSSVKIEGDIIPIERVKISLFSFLNIKKDAILICKIDDKEKKIVGKEAVKSYKRIKIAKHKGYENMPYEEKEKFLKIVW